MEYAESERYENTTKNNNEAHTMKGHMLHKTYTKHIHKLDIRDFWSSLNVTQLNGPYFLKNFKWFWKSTLNRKKHFITLTQQIRWSFVFISKTKNEFSQHRNSSKQQGFLAFFEPRFSPEKRYNLLIKWPHQVVMYDWPHKNR